MWGRLHFILKKVNEYDQEITQSQTADNTMNLDTLYSGGGSRKPLFLLDIFASDIPYLQMFCIILVSCAIA